MKYWRLWKAFNAVVDGYTELGKKCDALEAKVAKQAEKIATQKSAIRQLSSANVAKKRFIEAHCEPARFVNADGSPMRKEDFLKLDEVTK